MIHLMIYIVVICLVAAVLLWALRELGVPEPINKIARVAIIVIVILLIIGAVAGILDNVVGYSLYPPPRL